MAGLADIFNNPDKLESASRFLMNFGQGLTQANSQGLSPFASLAYGFGAGGTGIQDLKKERQERLDLQQRREILNLQQQQLQGSLDEDERQRGIASRASAILQGRPDPSTSPVDLTAGTPLGPALPKLTPEQQRRAMAQLLAEKGDLEEALDVAIPVADTDSKDAAIARTLRDNPGTSRQEAQLIVDGIIDRVVDPTTGNVSLVNKLTGSQRVLSPNLPAPGEPAPVAPDDTLYNKADDVAGAVPTAKEWWSKTFGQVNQDWVAEDVVEARQDVRAAQNELIRSLSINPRFPVGEINRIREETKIEPATFDSPGALRARMRSVDAYLNRRLANEIRASQDLSLSVKDRQDAAAAANNIRNFRAQLGVPQGGASLSEEDDALVRKYLR